LCFTHRILIEKKSVKKSQWSVDQCKFNLSATYDTLLGFKNETFSINIICKLIVFDPE
jgi:hypothetical protein